MEEELERMWTLVMEGHTELSDAIKKAEKVIQLRVGFKLELGQIKPGNPVNLSDLISHFRSKQTTTYEDQVREHRLKEALRAKKELEEKLSFIADTISTLNAKPATPPKAKIPRALDKEMRKLRLEAEEAKRKESLEFAKRQMNMQKDRQRRRLMQVQQMTQAITGQIEQDKAQRAEMEQKIREEKEKRLEMMRNQAELRREELQMARERIRSHVVLKTKVTMPELEQRKKELASKRLGPHPPDSTSLGIKLYPESQRLRSSFETRNRSPAAQLPVVEEEKLQFRPYKPKPSFIPPKPEAPSNIHPPNSSLSEGKRPPSKPPLPYSKPSSHQYDPHRDKLLEAVEKFKASKSEWDSELPSLNHTQHLSSQGSKASLGSESRLSEGLGRGEDDVIASIRAKLSLQT